MVPVPLFDLKFLHELAAGAVGTSNRRHGAEYPNVFRQLLAHAFFSGDRTGETPYDRAHLSKGAVMHKFRVGQLVDLTPPRTAAPAAARGAYSILRLLPEEKEGPQYRIKSKHEHHERIAHERDLTPTGAPKSVFS
jgi:hypothetical protein